jgi:hypothetical protein
MQAAQRMQRSVCLSSGSAKMRERPLSSSNRWTSFGPYRSPGHNPALPTSWL